MGYFTAPEGSTKEMLDAYALMLPAGTIIRVGTSGAGTENITTELYTPSPITPERAQELFTAANPQPNTGLIPQPIITPGTPKYKAGDIVNDYGARHLILIAYGVNDYMVRYPNGSEGRINGNSGYESGSFLITAAPTPTATITSAINILIAASPQAAPKYFTAPEGSTKEMLDAYALMLPAGTIIRVGTSGAGTEHITTENYTPAPITPDRAQELFTAANPQPNTGLVGVKTISGGITPKPTSGGILSNLSSLGIIVIAGLFVILLVISGKRRP